ncbi:hypothetical protein ACWGH7_09215 [Streptomyces cyaneofuscatus]|uniref:hypothetical protein n=1 Tax=Streptomyces TaxID=1883 RepID=UPI000475D45E|nr:MULTISPECIES: hypothetical protein [Streptomyces]MZF58210.1 hypothetical protein [Streptomyces sp. SID5594]ONI51813.1 hypothetical protein STIB_40350 [Streptomyces sp. IB2014 011-1]RDV49761.1 hypothetical protein DDV98_21855 [Streptomyces sp. IB2014 011-12]CAD5958941.1 conserved protein of unknown function [Streptomyces sp. KY75]CAD5980959.1 conserved protein of unknown function [Streptomyces sp. KY70]
MDQTHASSPLAGAVHDLATEVVLALRSGDHLATVCGAAGIDEENRTGIAAARVIGADLLLPSVLYGRHPHPGDVAVLDRAVREFPPKPDAPAATAWSHWHMISTLQRMAQPPGTTGTTGTASPGTYEEPDAAWLEQAPWQSFTHQLSVLAPLAVPAAPSAVQRAAAARAVDLARGFVRAVRRRDWLQAAGAGRWLAAIGGEPATLGLERGLDFVELMGGHDPRVTLHVRAARLMAEARAR